MTISLPRPIVPLPVRLPLSMVFGQSTSVATGAASTMCQGVLRRHGMTLLTPFLSNTRTATVRVWLDSERLFRLGFATFAKVRQQLAQKSLNLLKHLRLPYVLDVG